MDIPNGTSSGAAVRPDDGEPLLASRAMQASWDERGMCHACGHWSVEICNVDGFHYCSADYPEGLRS